jgi:hypothetical protein
MPAFWSRPPVWVTRNGGWREDPVIKNWKRYHDGAEFTPYVRIGEFTWWDLARSVRVPRPDELDEELEGSILADSGVQLEVTKSAIRVSWQQNRPGVSASTIIDLGALAQFEVRPASSPEDLRLSVVGYNGPRYSAGAIHPGGSGVISMSMIFGRQHESTLHDLREVLERICERRLAAPAEGSLAGSPEDETEPEADLAGETRPSAEPAEHHVPPAGEPADAGRDNPDAVRRVRPALPVLAVSVETAPDTDEWLSFRATTVAVLISDRNSAREGDSRGRDGPADLPLVDDRGSGHG